MVPTHQVLQHRGELVTVMVEVWPIVKPNGILGAYETSMSVNQWYPEYLAFDEWLDFYVRVARANGGDLTAGRKIYFMLRLTRLIMHGLVLLPMQALDVQRSRGTKPVRQDVGVLALLSQSSSSKLLVAAMPLLKSCI